MNLWRVATDESTGVTSGVPQPLTVPAPYIRHFGLSADGSLGVYSTVTQTNNLARIRFDEKSGKTIGAIQFITSGPRDFGHLDVGTDEQVVLTTSSRLQEDLFVVAGDGSGMRNMTSDRHRDRNPHWSRDGRQILFYSDRSKNYEVWSIDRDGGGLRQLTHTDGRRYFPVPSPDGLRLVSADINARELFVYDARDFTKAPEQLPRPGDEIRAGNSLTPTDWSPDGKLLSGIAGSLTWTYSFDTKAYRMVTPWGGASTAQFLPDSRRFIANRSGRLLLLNVIGGQVDELLAIPGENIGMARFNPDWSFLYFLHGSQSGDIWLVRFGDAGNARSGSK